MSWLDPAGLYRPGTTLVHRSPLWLRLGGLAALGVALVVLRGPWSALAVLAATVVLAAVARIPLRPTLRGLAPVLVTAALVGAYQTWQRGWDVGVEVAADLVSLVLAATVVTVTTRADVLLDAVVRTLGPLRRVGVNPDAVALAIALMLRTMPALADLAGQTRDAARARGLDHNPRALLIPLAIRTVGRAQTTGDALAARGIGDGAAARGEPGPTVSP